MRLQQNGFPASTTALRKDVAALATFEIERKSGPATAKTGSLVHVTGCLTLQGERERVLTNATEPEENRTPNAAHRAQTMHATGF